MLWCSGSFFESRRQLSGLSPWDEQIEAAGGCRHVTQCPQDLQRMSNHAKDQCRGVQETKAAAVTKYQS